MSSKKKLNNIPACFDAIIPIRREPIINVSFIHTVHTSAAGSGSYSGV